MLFPAEPICAAAKDVSEAMRVQCSSLPTPQSSVISLQLWQTFIFSDSFLLRLQVLIFFLRSQFRGLCIKVANHFTTERHSENASRALGHGTNVLEYAYANSQLHTYEPPWYPRSEMDREVIWHMALFNGMVRLSYQL